MPRKPDRPEPTQDESGKHYGAWQAPAGTFEELQAIMNELDLFMSKRQRGATFNERGKAAQRTDYEPAPYGITPTNPAVMEDRMPRVSPYPEEREFQSRGQKMTMPTAGSPSPTPPTPPNQLQGPGMTFTENMHPDEIRHRLTWGHTMYEGMQQASQPQMLFSPFAAAATTQMAPVAYRGFQEGYGSVPGFHLWNLLRNVGAHPEGSTLGAQELGRLGYRVPKPPVR